MGERGYGSVLALTLLLGGALLVGLATDVARLASAWREATHVAHTAAEVGAGWVEEAALYRGDLVVNSAAATAAALSFASGDDRSVEVVVYRSRVCVTVRVNVAPGPTRVVGAAPTEVVATECAEPRRG